MYEIFLFKLHTLTKKIESDRASVFSFPSTQQGVFNRIHKAFGGDAKEKETINKAWGEAMVYLSDYFKT